ISEKLKKLCNKYAPVETGGVLIGLANYKTKTIHVLDIITEPQDSHGTCVGFTRGIKGLPEEINRIKELTGNMIGYIGEWHSHPMNLKQLSHRDHETIADLKILNDVIPIPTCAVIVTPDDVLAFVYE
ncbi:MAG TPA: Mov34/MPN/PAD-1 family protein, partial [Candidatus Babeliaceae bacterium]|nr:Mov34/MPN/PAD-1 family protein [Candidatus Babeliaceae bacterium]